MNTGSPESLAVAERAAVPSRTERLKELPRKALGSRRDWTVPRPRLWRLRPGLRTLGPLAIVASVLVPWFAFTGAVGEEGGNVTFGLFIGAASITLMAWSFLLALRVRFLERSFGGLDSMYKAHRWAGALAIVAMWLHTSNEPELENGIAGASESIADTAQELAGTGQNFLYALVGLSLIRWFPYRYWRWTHKLLGVPFAFACWHFYTAEKTYANWSAWGWFFNLVMLTGLVAYLARVVWRDMLAPGRRYVVQEAVRQGSTTELVLKPQGRKLVHEAGQFAVIKLQTPGLKEPHVFTIASSPDSETLRFFVRDLGDWTAKVQDADLVGSEVIVEGPHGEFQPFGRDGQQVVWIAGGVGITPFLSAIDGLTPTPFESRPVLAYCVPTAEDATAIEALRAADADGRIRLELFESSTGRRFSEDGLRDIAGTLDGAHVAVCGPAGLVASARAAAERLGADEVETEEFDIRSGIGPDLSRDIEDLITTP